MLQKYQLQIFMFVTNVTLKKYYRFFYNFDSIVTKKSIH